MVMGFRAYSTGAFANEPGHFDLGDNDNVAQLHARNSEVVDLMAAIYRGS